MIYSNSQMFKLDCTYASRLLKNRKISHLIDKYKQVSSICGNFFYNVQNASQELPHEFGSMSKCPELESEDGNFGEAKISQYIITIFPFVLFCSCDDSKMWKNIMTKKGRCVQTFIL